MQLQVTGCTIWQEDFTAKSNEYAKAGILKYAVVHQKQENQTEGCSTAGSREPFPGHTVDEMEAPGMVNTKV